MVTLVEVGLIGKTRCALLVKAGPIEELLNLPSKPTATYSQISVVIEGSLKWEKASRAWAGCRELQASNEIMSLAEACQALVPQASPIRTLVVEQAEADSEVTTKQAVAA